jgi:hypothetical protein
MGRQIYSTIVERTCVASPEERWKPAEKTSKGKQANFIVGCLVVVGITIVNCVPFPVGSGFCWYFCRYVQ